MKKTHIFLLLFLLFGSNSLRAQSAPSAAASAVRQIVLGNATVPLDGLWKFHTGDNMAWAQPGFDDSAWGTQDLTPPPGSHDPWLGSSGFVPGWTAQGYKGYHGYAWYRLRVDIQSGRIALALKMPDWFDDAYQVYVNGHLIGQFGRFTAHGVTSYSPQPRDFPLPANVHSGPATIAVRMWMAASTPLQQQEAGGLHGPPTLGQTSVIRALLGMYWYALDRRESGIILSIAINFVVLLVAFGLYGLDRTEPAYLWLGLTCSITLTFFVLLMLGRRTTWIAATSGNLLSYAVLVPASFGLWVLFWGYWFRLDGMARLQRMVWSLVVLLGVDTAMRLQPLSGSVVPVHASVWLTPLALVFQMLVGVLLVWVTVWGIRRNRAEGWLALPAVMLMAIGMFADNLLATPVEFFLFGAAISLPDAGDFVSLAIITVLLLRRFLRAQREREQWRLEMEQARQVQQMLIPVTPPDTPGFAVESVYLPAQKVGGDFFQVLPGGDGSLLVVVGDVSGKGLKAAMTVSTIVGALRGCALRGPADVLAYLNRVLHGQISGFVTCCAALIASDGAMTIANAGHLSPYRNGKEMIVAGGLPLGILAEGSYEETHYQLAPGDRLTFVSDGVVEATNDKKELFGFERTQQISNQSAAAIADTAKQFGQEDDISVLAVTRMVKATA